jgi:ABC-type lipoprotein export system ATPase subunit
MQHVPGKLSGGEQQRVAIARAIIGEPELVIADEPTGDLDSLTAQGIVTLLHDLNQRLNITFLVATHNLVLCERADRILEIKDGIIHA